MFAYRQLNAKHQHFRDVRSLSTVFVLFLLYLTLMFLSSCQATAPGDVETRLAAEAKKMKIGGKDWQNPTADSPSVVQTGMEHFQHHCQVCHGLDGHGTGVPFAAKMSPPALDLADKDVQQYTDGQLKWIIENGIRFSGMPGWKGELEDDEMWSIVRFLRHLPEKGSLGIPAVYKEGEEEHHEMTQSPEQHGKPENKHPHQ
jgi:mono/diheme cytochrome c family protein